jgi:outer membrane receptor protein involved in Fe transport
MALVSSPLLAQSTTASSNDDSTLSEVVVTGSRLKSGFDQPTPVAVVGAEQLAARAPTNVINILNELPQFRSGVSQTTGNRGTVPAGINSLDLRGLGSFETLILLDGMRLPSILSGGPADVNTIPGLLVERIETVTGGASAAYGSNAVAGVVQFILKRDYEGFEGTLQGGETGEGDGGSVLAGFGWGRKITDRLHLMVGGEYDHEASVPGPLSRDWGRKETGLISLPATRPSGTPARVFADGVRFNTMSPGGLVTTGPLRGLNFLPNGQTGAFDFGTLTGGNLMAGSTSNQGLSPFAYGGLKIGLDRANLLARATFDINDSIESWVEGSYHQMKADQDSAQTYFRENNIIILRNNPYLPASVGAQMDANGLTQITIGRSNDEIGGALGKNENKQYRFAAGLRGSFGKGWDWDAFMSYARSEYKQIFRNEVFVAN